MISKQLVPWILSLLLVIMATGVVLAGTYGPYDMINWDRGRNGGDFNNGTGVTPGCFRRMISAPRR